MIHRDWGIYKGLCRGLLLVFIRGDTGSLDYGSNIYIHTLNTYIFIYPTIMMDHNVVVSILFSIILI